MNWTLFPILLQLVQTSSFRPSYYKKISYSALTLVNASRCSDAPYCSEDELHTLAYEVRILVKSVALCIRHTASIAIKEYVLYLQRLRAKTLGRTNTGRIVEELTRKNVIGYNLSPTPISVVIKAMRRIMEESSDEAFDKDLVRQEYLKSSNTALEACYGTLNDYEKFIRFPWLKVNVAIPECLKALKDFISTTLVQHDVDATYPDAVMCISVLQYLKYVALAESQLHFLKLITQQYDALLNVLKNMTFKPNRRNN